VSSSSSGRTASLVVTPGKNANPVLASLEDAVLEGGLPEQDLLQADLGMWRQLLG